MTERSSGGLSEKENLHTRGSYRRRDYRQYEFSPKEFSSAAALAALIVLFFSWFFYRNLLFAILLSPIAVLIVREARKRKGEKVRESLTEQFKECILSVSASLQAGYAVENAFMESREDIRNLYGERSEMYEELEGIRRGLVINISLEELLLDLGARSGCEEIAQFAQMFSIAKRGGGSLSEMISTSANLISQKIEARSEVGTILAGRKMEQNVMRLMPFGITFYVGSTYPGFFDPLYHDLSGIAIMTLCLALYIAAVWVGEKIFQGIWKQLDGKGVVAPLAVMRREGILGKAARIGETVYEKVSRGKTPGPGEEKIRRYLEVLYPEENRESLLTRYFGGKLGMSALLLGAGGFLSGILFAKQSLGGGDGPALTLFLLTLAASIGTFFLTDKDLGDQMKKRKDLLMMGYPNFVHSLALYLIAGMTIRGAFSELGKTNDLALRTVREIGAGQSEVTAYERFGKRAGVREYVKLSTLLCQNLKKGNSTLLARLEEEAMLSAESRIQSGKRLGEEAGTKLLIPMVMMLAIVMLIIMVPAFSMMGV
ncbi:MAG: type II secretion system F family protein [Lachnospiraceae bacterium]|nr:type II secretion system F family protein [Lachnospiraceae bacterium]